MLLKVPGVDLNLASDVTNWAPVTSAAFIDGSRCLPLLLGDPRVRVGIAVGHPDGVRRPCSLLHYMLTCRRYHAAEWLVALRSPEENFVPPEHPHLNDTGSGTAHFVRSYMRDPVLTRQRTRVKLGFADSRSAQVFAMFVMLADDFVNLAVQSAPSSLQRFLHVGQRLPLELQMILAWRCVGCQRDVVLSRDLEPAILALTN